VAGSGEPLPPRRLLRGSRRLQGLVGRRVLAGMTFVDSAGRSLGRRQACGTVSEVADGVVTLELPDGEQLLLPADEGAFTPARPGSYTLAATGEVVVDPDFLCTWSVMVPPGDSGGTGDSG
jgi:hypothetical protein